MSAEKLSRPSQEERLTTDNFTTDTRRATPARPVPLPLDKVEAAIRSIQYGVVQVIIQDGLIVQIDKTEKIRLR